MLLSTHGLVRLRPRPAVMVDAVVMSFEPSEDPDALSAHVAGAARVLI